MPLVGPASAVRPPQLLVLLHGAGGDEHAWRRWWPLLPPGWVVVNLRAPRAMPRGGWFWYPVHFRRRGVHVSHRDVDAAFDVLDQVLDRLPAALGLAPVLPMAVAGFSQGGALAAAAGLLWPERVGALAVFNARVLSRALQRAARVPRMVNRHAYVAHGRDDEVIPAEEAWHTAAQLRRRGWRVEGCLEAGGHELRGRAVARFARWLVELEGVRAQ